MPWREGSGDGHDGPPGVPSRGAAADRAYHQQVVLSPASAWPSAWSWRSWSCCRRAASTWPACPGGSSGCMRVCLWALGVLPGGPAARRPVPHPDPGHRLGGARSSRRRSGSRRWPSGSAARATSRRGRSRTSRRRTIPPRLDERPGRAPRGWRVRGRRRAVPGRDGRASRATRRSRARRSGSAWCRRPRARHSPAASAAHGVGAFERVAAQAGIAAIATPAMIVDAASAADADIAGRLADADLVYFPGGDPDRIPIGAPRLAGLGRHRPGARGRRRPGAAPARARWRWRRGPGRRPAG